MINQEQLDISRQKYRNYINMHTYKVQESWNEIKNKISICKDNNELVTRIDNQIMVHDRSKLDPAEFEPYRRKFYPVDDEDKISQKEFDIALNHHYYNNPHHPEYFQLHPDHDIFNNTRIACTIEMICDWMACGKDHCNTALDWYNSNADRFNFRPEIKEIVEKTLHEIYN